MNKFRHEIHQKADFLGNKIDAALAGKSITLCVFSNDCRSPEQPVKGQAIWFTFRRSNLEPWVACHGRITELIDNDKFEAVAVDDDGTPVPSVTVCGVHNNLVATADIAKNVYLRSYGAVLFFLRRLHPCVTGLPISCVARAHAQEHTNRSFQVDRLVFHLSLSSPSSG